MLLAGADSPDGDRLLRIRYLGFAGEGSVGDDVAYAVFSDYIEDNLRVHAKVFLRKPYLAPMAIWEEKQFHFHVLGGGTCLSPLGQKWADRKVAALARWGFPYCLYGVSGVDEPIRVNSLRTEASARMLASIARGSLFSSVRDSEAYALLSRPGATRVSLDSDPTFYYVRRLYQHKDKPAPEPRKIGIVLAEVKGAWLGVYEFDLQRVIDTVRSFCRELLREGYEVELLMFNARDAELYADFAQSLGLSSHARGQSDLERLADQVSSCRALIGMRLHSAIFACACGTPFIPIAYKKPITTLVRTDWDYPYCVDVREVSLPLLDTLFHQLLAKEESIRSRLQQIGNEAFRRQERALELVATLIRNHSRAKVVSSPVNEVPVWVQFWAQMVGWRIIDWPKRQLGHMRRRVFRRLGLRPPGRPG